MRRAEAKWGRLLWAATLSAVIACGTNGGGPTSASVSAGPAPSASSSAPVATPPPDDTVTGSGVTKILQVDAADSGCAPSRFDLAQNLLRGELTLAGRPGASGAGEIAASWLIQLQNKAQIGFAGFDGEARRIARDRGIGNAREHAPRLFATGDAWTVVWFDVEGLAYARPVWDAQPAPTIEHLSPLKDVNPADVAFAATPAGPLVVASPFATQGDQLSLFLFAPIVEGQKPRALGRTKSGKKPRDPAVAADSKGYTVAWLEEDGHVEAARFDAEGNLQGGAPAVAKPAERSGMMAASIEGNNTVIGWLEGGSAYVRLLGPDAKPASPIFLVGKAKNAELVSAGTEAILAYVGEAEGAADQMLAVRVGASGPSSTAVRVSEGRTGVLDPPAVAVAGPKLAFAWTEVMNPLMSAKRAVLRTVAASCLK